MNCWLYFHNVLSFLVRVVLFVYGSIFYRPVLTIAVDMGRKATKTKQTNQKHDTTPLWAYLAVQGTPFWASQMGGHLRLAGCIPVQCQTWAYVP